MPKVLRCGIWLSLQFVAALAFAGSRSGAVKRSTPRGCSPRPLCSYAIAYRFYSKFIAAKVFALDANRATPAVRLEDGRDYVPTNRWIVFGTISRPSPAPDRWSGRPSRRSSATCPASSGSSSASHSAAPCRTS